MAWLIESLAEAIVAAVGPAWSSASRAWAAVRFAWATSSWTWSDESSMVARTSPAVTLSPGTTLTAVTVPDVPKLSSLTDDEATDPDRLTLLTIVPTLALAVTSVAAAAFPKGFKAQIAAPAMSATTTSSTTQRRHRRPRG